MLLASILHHTSDPRTRVTAAQAQIPYGFQITPAQLLRVNTPTGVDIFARGRPNDVPANTVLDIARLVVWRSSRKQFQVLSIRTKQLGSNHPDKPMLR
jgi:hypothetical protein